MFQIDSFVYVNGRACDSEGRKQSVADHLGRRGQVVDHILDCGGTPADPLHRVIFANDESAVFWAEELIAAPE